MKIPYPLKRYLNITVGVTYSDIEDKMKKLRGIVCKRLNKDENEISAFDLVKAIHTKRIKSIKDYHDLQSEYYGMALLLNELQFPYLEKLIESNRNHLLHYHQEDALTHIKILASSNGCESCNKQNDKIMTVAEALEKMPLPHKECSYILYKNAAPFCRCCYSPHISWS